MIVKVVIGIEVNFHAGIDVNPSLVELNKNDIWT